MALQQDLQLTGAIVSAVERVVGEAPRTVPLHAPRFTDTAVQYVTECVETGWVSSAGAFVGRFERMLADYTGAAHAVAVVNGTAALSTALHVAGVEAGDEVIMPSLTFVATANAAHHIGAVPLFVDVEPATMGLDPDRLAAYLDACGERRDGGCHNRATGRRIGAIVPMHTFGHPVALDALLAVAERWGLTVIEDAAESLGSFYNNRHTGTFGRLGILSFNGNKTVTTGGGGAIITNDEQLAARARHLTTTAKRPHPYEYFHDQPGFNYRMPNINAALGCAELERLDALIDAKRRLHARYVEAFEDLDAVTVFTGPHHRQSNCWLNALVLDAGVAERRDPILEALNAAQLQSRPVWRPMHMLPMYQACPRGAMSVTEDLCRRIINVPSSPDLIG